MQWLFASVFPKSWFTFSTLFNKIPFRAKQTRRKRFEKSSSSYENGFFKNNQEVIIRGELSKGPIQLHFKFSWTTCSTQYTLSICGAMTWKVTWNVHTDGYGHLWCLLHQSSSCCLASLGNFPFFLFFMNSFLRLPKYPLYLRSSWPFNSWSSAWGSMNLLFTSSSSSDDAFLSLPSPQAEGNINGLAAHNAIK